MAIKPATPKPKEVVKLPEMAEQPIEEALTAPRVHGRHIIKGTIRTGALAVGSQFWVHSMTWTATDEDTASWSSGTLTFADGGDYSISAGNTGNIAAKTYVYFDGDTSLTVLQTSTTYSDAVGDNKAMLAVVSAGGAGEKCLIAPVFSDGTTIAGPSIVTGYISADRIEASSLAVGKLSFTPYVIGTNDLDDVSDGTTYAKVLNTDITAGHVLLSAVTGDLDDISDGSSYGKVAVTSITAGKIIVAGLDSGVTVRMFADSATKTNIEAWRHASDVTAIDGGDIYTGSVTAAKITVANLAAIKADIGAITAGSMAGVTLSIGSGNAIFKATASGIQLGHATYGSAPFRVNMSGELVATSANITGNIQSGSTITGSAITGGSIAIGAGNNVFKATASGIHAGHDVYASAPFRVNMLGELVATTANIGGTILGGTTITAPVMSAGTISGTTITGGLIRTSASGKRVEITTSDQIELFYSSGDAVLLHNDDGLRLRVEGGLYADSNIRTAGAFKLGANDYLSYNDTTNNFLFYADGAIGNSEIQSGKMFSISAGATGKSLLYATFGSQGACQAVRVAAPDNSAYWEVI